MKIYLAHEPADAQTAADIETALRAARHTVFRRQGQLAAGRGEGDRVRKSIAASDFCVFLASPLSLSPGSLALSDLTVAGQKWRTPKGHVLAVRMDGPGAAVGEAHLAGLPVIGSFADPGQDIVAAVARERGTRVQALSWPAAAAVTVAAYSAAIGAAYVLAMPSAPQLTSANIGEVAFEIGGMDYVSSSWGEARRFSLKQTKGPHVDYRCKVGPSPGPNIKNVTHDERCTEIVVTATDGPFVDEAGQPYERGNSYHLERDFLPVKVETKGGQQFFETVLHFPVANGTVGYKLRGLDRDADASDGVHLIEPGRDYALEVTTQAGLSIVDDFSCRLIDRDWSGTSPAEVVILKNCSLCLKNAQPGIFRLKIEHSKSSYADDVNFDLVNSGARSAASSDTTCSAVSAPAPKYSPAGKWPFVGKWGTGSESCVTPTTISESRLEHMDMACDLTSVTAEGTGHKIEASCDAPDGPRTITRTLTVTAQKLRVEDSEGAYDLDRCLVE